MKTKLKACCSIILALVIFLIPMNCNAANNYSTNEWTEMEKIELKEKYKQLFPDHYIDIILFEQEGIDTSITEPVVIYDGEKECNGTTYSLTVYDNRQILICIEESLPVYSLNAAEERYYANKQFTMGDLGHYTTFVVSYVISRYGHSYIDRYDFQGAGFVLNPFGKCYKKYEDSSGNAYIGYANCSMYPDGSGTLYDLGVCVGKSGAHKVFRLSQGADAFTWYLLNAFI